MRSAAGIHVVVQVLKDRKALLSLSARKDQICLEVHCRIRLEKLHDCPLLARPEVIVVSRQNGVNALDDIPRVLADLPPHRDPPVDTGVRIFLRCPFCGALVVRRYTVFAGSVFAGAPGSRRGPQDRVEQFRQVLLERNFKAGEILRLQIGKRLHCQRSAGQSQPLSSGHDPGERRDRRRLFRHQFQHLGFQERIIALRLLSGLRLGQPSSLHLLAKEPLQVVCREVMDHLVQAELRLVHLHHLKRKIRIHGRRSDLRQKAPEMLREPGQRRAAREPHQVRGRQRVTEIS